MRARLCAISRCFFDLALEHEAGFRQFVGMTLIAWSSGEAKPPMRRAGRRIAMYERALAGGNGRLSEDRKQMADLMRPAASLICSWVSGLLAGTVFGDRGER